MSTDVTAEDAQYGKPVNAGFHPLDPKAYSNATSYLSAIEGNTIAPKDMLETDPKGNNAIDFAIAHLSELRRQKKDLKGDNRRDNDIEQVMTRVALNNIVKSILAMDDDELITKLDPYFTEGSPKQNAHVRDAAREFVRDQEDAINKKFSPDNYASQDEYLKFIAATSAEDLAKYNALEHAIKHHDKIIGSSKAPLALQGVHEIANKIPLEDLQDHVNHNPIAHDIYLDRVNALIKEGSATGLGEPVMKETKGLGNP